MLESLDEIDWSSFHDAYGEASDVPTLIRALAASDRETRSEAIHELYGTIWHQGTVYEATAYAVPFLIELLQERIPDRHEIVGLLQAVATGSSYLDVHGGFDRHRKGRQTSQFQEDLARELQWVKAARDAVMSGLDTYLALAADDDQQLRATLPYLLAVCNEQQERVESVLHDLTSDRSSEEVRASAMLGLLRMRQRLSARDTRPSASVEQLALIYRARMVQKRETPLVRFIAAECYIESCGNADITEALAVAHQTMSAASEAYGHLVWNQDNEPFANIARALTSRREAQIDNLLEGLKSPDLANKTLRAIEEAASESRSYSKEVAPLLVREFAKHGEDMALRISATVARLGEAVIEPLEKLQGNLEGRMLEIAVETLKLIKERRAEHQLERILQFPVRHKSTESLIEEVGSRWRDNTLNLWLPPAIAELGRRGSEAMDADPLLEQILDYGNPWMRGICVWALWHITRERERVWSVLMEELQHLPANFLVLDCLADMGSLAADAVPVLRDYVETDRRLTTCGVADSWNHWDDMFRAACASTLAAIRNAEP